MNDISLILAPDTTANSPYEIYSASQSIGASFGTPDTFVLELAESYLTPRLFEQIIARIERLARHAVWSGARYIEGVRSGAPPAGVSLGWVVAGGKPSEHAQSAAQGSRERPA